MRPILSACSRLSSLRPVQPHDPSVSRRTLGGLNRRDFHVRISPSLQGLFAVKAFHLPDEENPHLADCHLSFAPGEVFTFGDDEYRIERKLRGRMTSMVWLAMHTNTRKPARDGSSFTAFKVFDILFSAKLAEDPRRNPDLRHVHDLKIWQKAHAPGSQYCERTARVLFGPHLCIVKEPCGPTLTALQETQPHRSFTLPVTKWIVRQTLLALHFMHTTMKRTHIANIQAFLASTSPKMAHRSLWDRLRSSLSSSPAEGGATLKAQALPAFGLSPSLENLEVRLGRCEYATPDKELERLAMHEAMDGHGGPLVGAFNVNMLHAPLLLAAPEAIWGWRGQYSPPINIWAVGHLLFQCLTGEVVYTKRLEWADHDVAFPDFDEMYTLCDPRVLETRLRSVAHVRNEMRESDAQATCALLARCFDSDPTARPTAKQLLKDDWFRS